MINRIKESETQFPFSILFSHSSHDLVNINIQCCMYIVYAMDKLGI